MSCCGVGSKAMFLLLDGQITVRSGKTGGRIQKWLYLENCQSNLAQLGQNAPKGVLHL